MWIFTVFGFFSIVEDFTDPETMVVRSRVRADLVAFQRRVKARIGVAGKIAHTPERDYPYRLRVSRAAFAKVLQDVALDDTKGVRNFKSAVAKAQGHERAEVYHHVWSDLLDLQRLKK